MKCFIVLYWNYIRIQLERSFLRHIEELWIEGKNTGEPIIMSTIIFYGHVLHCILLLKQQRVLAICQSINSRNTKIIVGLHYKLRNNQSYLLTRKTVFSFSFSHSYFSLSDRKRLVWILSSSDSLQNHLTDGVGFILQL